MLSDVTLDHEKNPWIRRNNFAEAADAQDDGQDDDRPASSSGFLLYGAELELQE